MSKRLQRPKLRLTDNQRQKLCQINRSRNAPAAAVERSRILLLYAQRKSVSAISKELGIHRGKVYRCIDKALAMGMEVALKDLPRSGRPAKFTEEAVAWVIGLACQKPKDFGYPHELWTMTLLSEHIREHCREQGHPCLQKIARGTISKLLSRHKLKPHKVRYYLALRDPNFDERAREVISVYKEAQSARKEHPSSRKLVFLAYDEKPGIQAIKNTAPDLPPLPGKYATWSRDHEYQRLGTMSLLAAIDLVTGKVHQMVVKRHRSCEFISFLKKLIHSHSPKTRFRIVMDNHSVHTSKETRKYLATVPNRFEFVFTPKHASWLNLAEVFFSKLSRTILRGMRVDSTTELKNRIRNYCCELNRNPVPYTWKYMIGIA